MKICILTSRAFHLFHLARELASLGNEVDIYGYIPEFRARFYNYGQATYHSNFLHLFPDSVFALQRPIQSIQKNATERLYSKSDRQMNKVMPDCDVFIGLSAVSVESFTYAKKQIGALTICERGSAHVLSQARELEGNRKARLSKNYIERELASYREADYVSIPSIYSEKTFIDNNYEAERLFINNYGVNLERFKPLPCEHVGSGKVKRVLFVGGWTYQKGCDFINEILKIDTSISITHAGMKGDLEFPKSSRFVSLGHVENNKLPELMNCHDVLILPSRQDGFGMVLLEALACGLPIVASRNTGVHDLMACFSGEFISVMNEMTPASLLESIDMVVNKVSSADRLEISKQTHAKYSWAAYGQRYNDFLTNKLLQRNSVIG